MVDPAVVVVVGPPAVVVVVGGVVLHVGLVIVSVSSVTAPLRASTRPSMVVPVVTVMLVRAKIVPRKKEPVPSVAELPICQKMLQDWAPFVRLTTLADPVVSADPTWKTNTASGLPSPSSVRAPLSNSDEAEL